MSEANESISAGVAPLAGSPPSSLSAGNPVGRARACLVEMSQAIGNGWLAGHPAPLLPADLAVGIYCVTFVDGGAGHPDDIDLWYDVKITEVNDDGTVRIYPLSEPDLLEERPNTHFFRTFPDGSLPETEGGTGDSVMARTTATPGTLVDTLASATARTTTASCTLVATLASDAGALEGTLLEPATPVKPATPGQPETVPELSVDMFMTGFASLSAIPFDTQQSDDTQPHQDLYYILITCTYY